MNSCLLVLLLLGQVAASPPQVAASPPLVAGKQLKFVGSFDVPNFGTWKDPPSQRSDYSMGVICYREDLDALYVVTHAQDATAVGLIKVPAKLSTTETIVGSQIEALLNLPSIPNQQVRLRGLFWDQPTKTLYYNYTAWYNVAGKDAAGFGAIRAGKPFGLWYAAHNNACAGYITRDPISGRLLIGSAIAQGVATSSLGPSAFRLKLDETHLPQPNDRIPVQPILFHPHGYPEMDATEHAVMSTGKTWLRGMEISGGVCVEGSLIVAVDEGEKLFYGTGKEFKNKFGFQPRSNYKGYHHGRYRVMLWFYSLAALDKGTRAPHNRHTTRPYEYFRVAQLPEGGQLGGLAYDSRRHRLFVSQSVANSMKTPRIYVYEIGTKTGSSPTASSLRARK